MKHRSSPRPSNQSRRGNTGPSRRRRREVRRGLADNRVPPHARAEAIHPFSEVCHFDPDTRMISARDWRAASGVLEAPWPLSGKPMSIRCDQRIGMVEEPRRPRDLPWPDGPPSLTANGQSETDCSGPTDLDPALGDCPGCDLGLLFAHPSRLVLPRCLRGNDVEPVVLVEAPHPASATCAKTSIPVEDERGALGSPIRKLTKFDGAHSVSAQVLTKPDWIQRPSPCGRRLRRDGRHR